MIYILLSLLFAAGAGYLSQSSQFWYDESFSYLVARLDPAHLIQSTAFDVHPPLYYLLISYPAQWIRGETGIRALSMVFSLLSLGVLYQILKDLDLPRPVIVMTFILMVVCPVQLYYAQEGRMYALLQFLVLVSVLAVLRRSWGLLGLGLTLILYTHNYGCFYWALISGVAVYIELRETAHHPGQGRERYDPAQWDKLPKKKSNLLGLGLGLGIPVIAYIPWALYALIPQIRFTQSGGHWILPLTAGNSIWYFYSALVGIWSPFNTVVILIMAVAAGLTMTVIQGVKDRLWILLGLGLGPWVIANIASLLVSPLLIARPLIPSTPFIFILIAWAIYRAGSGGRVLAGLLLLPVIGAGLYGLFAAAAGGTLHGDYLAIPQLNPGSEVIHLEDTTLLMFLTYGNPGDQRILTDSCPEELGGLGQRLRASLGIQSVDIRNLPDHYYLAMSVSALSNKCQEDLYDQLSAGAQVIQQKITISGKTGLFYVHSQ